jgi:hypothetical protein
MTSEEQRNLEVAKRYEELYNVDVERFVHECYTPDCVAYAMGGGNPQPEQFVRVENGLKQRRNENARRSTARDRQRGDCRGGPPSIPTIRARLAVALRGVLVCRDAARRFDRTYADYTNWPDSKTFAREQQ